MAERKIRDISNINKTYKLQQEARENVEASTKAASALLHSKKFQEYKDQLEADMTRNIEFLLKFCEVDPVKYAFRVRSVVEQLNMALLLLRNVSNDSQEYTEFKVCIGTKTES